VTSASFTEVRPVAERLRSKLFDVALVFWTALFAPAVVALAIRGAPERAVRRTARAWARGTLRLLGWCVGLTYVEEGRENIPSEPCLIVANHQSTWETFAFLALVPEVAIVAKQELLTIPIFAWFLRKAPMILIDRDSGTTALRKMVDESRVALSRGRSVLIFPEGTRRSVSAKIEFKRGTEFLYAKLGRRVLPVALNSGHFWGPDQRYKRPGTITVDYLGVIEPGLGRAEFTKQSQAVLERAKRNAEGAFSDRRDPDLPFWHSQCPLSRNGIPGLGDRHGREAERLTLAESCRSALESTGATSGHSLFSGRPALGPGKSS
jgi:1-acyl-sn-glycerol-3-phosphate acyltransferase